MIVGEMIVDEMNASQKDISIIKRVNKIKKTMTNIINELEQRNKELLEEINNLNKKREADIEELKLKI